MQKGKKALRQAKLNTENFCSRKHFPVEQTETVGFNGSRGKDNFIKIVPFLKFVTSGRGLKVEKGLK